MQMRTDQRFVGEHAPPREVHDWLEDHPEPLVTKRLVEGPRRGGNGICRVHEKQSSRAGGRGWFDKFCHRRTHPVAAHPGPLRELGETRTLLFLARSLLSSSPRFPEKGGPQ